MKCGTCGEIGQVTCINRISRPPVGRPLVHWLAAFSFQPR